MSCDKGEVEAQTPTNIINNILRVGNWNVQGLNAPGKINTFVTDCERYELDLLAVTELHWLCQDRI